MLFLWPMKLLIAFTFLLILGACSSYNRVLKSDDYTEKFVMANTLYDKGQFDRSVALYEQVYQRMPKSSEGEVAYYRLGKAFYAIEDWYMASYYLSAFSARFQFSPKCEETKRKIKYVKKNKTVSRPSFSPFFLFWARKGWGVFFKPPKKPDRKRV